MLSKLPASFIGMRWNHGHVNEVSIALRNSMTDDDIPEDIRQRFASLPKDGWPFIDPAFKLMKEIAPEGSTFTQSMPGERDQFGFKANGQDQGQ